MSDSAPDFSDELLADLHAGVLPPDVEADLWPRVMADPAAKAVIDALDRVSATLGDLGSAGLSGHGETMPTDLAARLDALFAEPDVQTPDLATVPAPSAAVLPLRRSDGPGQRPGRQRQWQWLAAACALIAVIGAASVWIRTSDRSNDSVQAIPTSTPTPTPLVLDGDLPADALYAAMGHSGAQGLLSDDRRLRECLTAVGIPEDKPTLGSLSVIFDQSPGVLVLVAGPTEDIITALIVNPDCAPDNAAVIIRKDI